jgi:sugar phosphate isomerase/epimerase
LTTKLKEMKQLILFAIACLIISCNTSTKKLDNTFYVFNNAVRTLPNAPEGVDAQAQLIKRLGYDGFSGHISDPYFERRKALDNVGLKMPEIYWGIEMDSTGNVAYKEGLKEIIKDSKNRELLVALYSNAEAFKHNREEGDPLLAKGIQELADFASNYNVKVAIYPHVNNYCETIEHCLSITKLVDRENFGIVFNTCHLLKVEGERGWEEKLINALPNIFMISINGADSGDTKSMDWDRLIQPLGEGTFDTWQLVKLAKDKGYSGPFGLQCYNIPQDCEVALTKSMNTWKEYQKRYSNE